MKLIWGYFAIFVYCISTALGAVWITESFSKLNSIVLTGTTIIIACFCFMSYHKVTGGKLLHLIKNYFKDVLVLNILTISAWWFMFIALQKITASVESAIFQGLIPIATLICEIIIQQSKIFSLRALGALLIFISLILLITAYLIEHNLLLQNSQIFSGIFFAALAGFTGGIYVYMSSQLFIKSNCTTLDIVCSRFYLLIVFSIILISQNIENIFNLKQFLVNESTLIFKLALLSCFSVIIPVFTFQYAIKTLGSAQVSLLSPTVPAIALGMEYILNPINAPLIPISIILVCMAVIFSNIWIKEK